MTAMTTIDKLAFKWLFESFTPEYQDECVNDMVQDFAKAWHFKKNRSYIQDRIKYFNKIRPDLNLHNIMQCACIDFLWDWSAYDERKTKSDVYIGHDAFLQN